MGEKIQNEYVPQYAVPPGETLLEVLETQSMSQAELARRLGRTPKMVNEIVAGKAPITPHTALLLEQVLGVPARLWNNLERQYREDLARLAAIEELAQHVSWLRQVPVKPMVQAGWIQAHEAPVDQLRELLRFFGVASPAQWNDLWLRPEAAFRGSPAFAADPVAVAAWLRKGALDARQIDAAPYDQARFRRTLRQIRPLTREPLDHASAQMVDLCAASGVIVVFVPSLPRIRASGATRWLTPDRALIQLSIRYRSDDQLWFTFFHEAGHLVLHGKREVFVDAADGDTNDKERQTDRFAADLLIPRGQWQRFARADHYYSQDEIVSFAARIGIAPGIVVGRLQKDGLLAHSHCNALKRRLEWRVADGRPVPYEVQ